MRKKFRILSLNTDFLKSEFWGEKLRIQNFKRICWYKLIIMRKRVRILSLKSELWERNSNSEFKDRLLRLKSELWGKKQETQMFCVAPIDGCCNANILTSLRKAISALSSRKEWVQNILNISKPHQRHTWLSGLTN